MGTVGEEVGCCMVGIGPSLMTMICLSRCNGFNAVWASGNGKICWKTHDDSTNDGRGVTAVLRDGLFLVRR